ncbi:non-specific lipid-transfer protein-like protein At2g13820 [Durio zibethinus]|uniref:Non-specific lipid-transfer protein-like protein At2g13820 n=1 Tax=Durio zibethinus TaxID=66656 RepID=A0A6P6A4L8_DURZI|nr:non-specific lipid-transfer protein-like protein At2g13820 [Durio zibethinus]
MATRSMKGTILAAVFIVAASLWLGAGAQSSSSCTNVLISMSPCLDYIQGNSSKPSSSCCSQLANVVRSQPQCLCEVLNGGTSSLGVSVNQTQAIALPTACNVKTPPASQCNASSSPSDSPSGTSIPPSSGGGSRTGPTTDNGTSAGNSTKLSFSLLFFFFLLFITAQASSFIAI